MEKIDSPSNQYIKFLYRLKNHKKNIIENNQFLVEGFHIIEEAIKSNIVIKLLTTSLDYFPDFIGEKIIVTPAIIEKLSSNKTNKGVIAVCDYSENEVNVEDFNKIIILDSINNPKNLGSIARNAKAFGIDLIVLYNDSTFKYNSESLRSSQGAVFQIPIVSLRNLSKLNEHKFYNFVLNSDSTELSSIKFENRFCLVFGNESKGISEEILSIPNSQKVHIKISNFESLNISVATGIVLYNLDK